MTPPARPDAPRDDRPDDRPAPPPEVHPTAAVAPGARLEPGVRVGPFCVVESGAEVGEGATLLPGVVLHAGARVGPRCVLGPYAAIGGDPLDLGHDGAPTLAVLEEGVVARDFATVHRASRPGGETRVGAGALVMSYVHVSHDAVVGRGAVLTVGVRLGGHARVGEGATLGANAMLHQHARVGDFAMLGAAGAANRDVLPFSMARGDPARHFRSNAVGLRRRGFDAERRRAIEGALRCLRRGDRAGLDALAAEHADARTVRDFVDASTRGVSGFAARPRLARADRDDGRGWDDGRSEERGGG